MALDVVERNLGSAGLECLRLDQRDVAASTPTRRAEAVGEVHSCARVTHSPIVEVVDLRASFVARGTSRSRRSRRGTMGTARDGRAKGLRHPMTAHSSPELVRWLADGQRLSGVCLDTLEQSERLLGRNMTLESENEMLREEVARPPPPGRRARDRSIRDGGGLQRPGRTRDAGCRPHPAEVRGRRGFQVNAPRQV